MKKRLLILCYSCLFLFIIVNAQNRSEKRGVSYQIPFVEDLEVLSSGVSWFYNWGIVPHPDVVNDYQEYMDYIPMAWNNGYNRTDLRNFLTSHPNVKYILGFNEPNFTAQANMTPSEAAAAWPELEAIADEFNLKIVGPAVNYAPANGAVSENGITYIDPYKYLDDFFAACPDCRVDYVAAHCYMNDPNGVEGFVNNFIQKYNKPVWLTEFCAWEYNAPLTSGAVAGYEYQRNSMIRKVEVLEKNPMVEKYAWFIPRKVGFPYMAFLETVRINPDVPPGVLTELGNIYINMSTFDSTRYYTIGEKIAAKDYIESFWVKLENSTDSESPYPIQLCTFESGQYVDYLIDVETAGEYPIYFRIANGNAVNPKFKIYSDGTLLKEEFVQATGDAANWETRYLNVALPQGKQTLRITSSGASACKMQWISISEPVGIQKQEIQNTEIFLNENKELQILSLENLSKTTIIDINGKLILENKNEKTIDVSSLSKGVYILNAFSENKGNKSFKFVLY